MKFFYRLIFPVSLLFAGSVSAQEMPSRLVSGEFRNAPATRFINELQTKSGYRFYFNPSQLDSININISFTQQPVDKVLEEAFAGTDIRYTVYQERYVFVTKGVIIQTSLPAELFGKSKQQPSAEVPVAAIPSATGEKKKPATEIMPENRLMEIGEKVNDGKKSVIISGYIRNIKTGEPVAGASVFAEGSTQGTTADQYGYYTLSLAKGRHALQVQGIGMKNTMRQVLVHSEGKMDVEMQEQVPTLKAVIVSALKHSNISRVPLGIERLNIKTIKQVPTIFGEADILRVMLTLPGVKTVGEASTGFNVRGGSTDQNLILFNDATIYNPSHFFGFFSAFNPEVIKEVELYKSSVPAKYGGRLASVLDVTTREGNKKNFAGSAGIGLVTSRLNIEGPIKKDKTSFIFGARSTYANWLLGLLPDEYEDSKASFYDLNLHISHQLNKKDQLFITGYLSQDRFNLNSDTVFGYNNSNLSIKWKHSFSSKLTGTFTTGVDRYKYNISSERNPTTAYKLSFDINQLNFKGDMVYYMSSKHNIDFGVSSIRYKLHPGTYRPLGKESLIVHDEVQQEQALESAFYLADRFNVNSNLSLNAGIRYSIFNYLGPNNVNVYAEGLPKEENNLTGTKAYNNGDFIKTYHGPEIRFSARYSVSSTFSIKAGYTSLRQYVHMLSNTTAISPTDIWKLSDPNIKPQYGDQVSFGLYKNLKSNTIEASVEVYYKRMKDYLDFKSGATLVMNHAIETEVMSTKGKAYGAELLVKKTAGKLNGWISYTYSRILLKMDDPAAGQVVNRGEYYPANYDKPHDLTMVANFRFSHRISISLNATYSTGRPITLPVGRYNYGGSERVLYSDRNAYRIPDYFRTDFSMNIEGNHKVKQKTHNSWTFGIYNLTGRKNPYSVYFVSENGLINGYKLSIFGSVLPFINYNIKF
ncbi:MAG TPA: carboxypeptidase-like regulatory domain-containing protein [Chitinophagaceae bacterium]